VHHTCCVVVSEELLASAWARAEKKILEVVVL
jgi:hypothetical protein